MMKAFRILPAQIVPASENEPAMLFYGYVTDIVDGDRVIARSEPHRGSAPLADLDRVVPVSASGDTKTVGEILAEAGLRVA